MTSRSEADFVTREGRTLPTLHAALSRCVWCGHRCTRGATACRYCRDLDAELRALYGVPMRDELRRAVRP